jgi:hypothetical protein
MNMILNMRTVAALFLFGCYSLLAAAQGPADAPAADAASTPPAAEAPADDSSKKSFRLKIDADGGEGGAPQGIQISLGDDEDHGAVVTKVIGRLETALEGLPEEVRNSEQGDIAELRAAMEDLRAMKDSPQVHREIRMHEEESALEQLAPIVALLVIFGGPVFIVAIVSRNNRRKREMVHQTIDRIIAQGKDVPVELLDALDKGSNGKSGLARGTVNVALGLGLGGMFLANVGMGAASIGLIPLAIGLAQLLVWKLEAPRSQQGG